MNGGNVQSAAIGLPFGRYRLIGQLGAGGMAVVYRAVVDGPRGFRRDVVIKRMLTEYAEDPQFINMMASEARLCALLRHPNIVQVSEFGEVEGEYYIAMELVDGSDLNGVMKRCRQAQRVPPVDAIAFIVSEVAGALGYAHTLCDETGQPLSIVHRDISPSNIMVTPAGIVKLLDFGIAKAATHLHAERTRTGTIKGKLSYMSPEQALGEPLDGRSDLFALGTVFYECLTSSRLFKGENDAETLTRICEQQIAPPSAYAPGIPADLDAVVLKMLARPRDERFQTGDEVVAALQPILARIGSDARALARFLATVATPARPTGTGPSTVIDLSPQETRPHSAPPTPTPAPAPSIEQSHSSQLVAGSLEKSFSALFSRKKPPVALMAGGIGVLVLIAGGLMLRSPKHAAPPVTTAAAPVATAMAAPTPPIAPAAVPKPAVAAPTAPNSAAASVELSVFGSLGAEVLVDGRSLGTIPLAEALPRHSGPHQLTVRKPGYVTLTRSVDSDEDATVRITLVPKPHKAATPGATKAAANGKHKQFDPEVIDDPFKH
jgi:serine/threonine protein kinase